MAESGGFKWWRRRKEGNEYAFYNLKMETKKPWQLG
jgi:hypothetical protein